MRSNYRPVTVWFLALLALCALANSSRAQIDPSQIKIKKKPVPTGGPVAVTFERINLGPGVNSIYSELFPVITPDEMLLFFVRKGDPTNAGAAKNPLDEDIWYSTRQSDGNWAPASRLDGPLNTTNYDGVRAVNSTGTRLYLQNIYREDGTGAKGFSVSERQSDGTWSFPEPLEIEDYYNDTSVAMMSVSNDEQTLILSLKRKESKGKHDLYLSRHQSGRRWSKPQLMEELSNEGDDIAPFIAYDDHTLYFSTDGRGGFGSHDIFVTRRLDSTWLHWSPPTNMGEPVNTPSFDAYFMVSARGDTAYFSSPHESSTRGFGKSDIWKLGLKPTQRPGFNMPSSDWQAANEKDLEGSLFRLDNVLFDIGKSSIREDSKQILADVAQTMKRLPNLRIEVQGHTDSDGDPDRNLRLSQERAESVRQYILSQGVPDDHVRAQGYGALRPIAPNNTPAGKALNRRVMIEVENNKAE